MFSQRQASGPDMVSARRGSKLRNSILQRENFTPYPAVTPDLSINYALENLSHALLEISKHQISKMKEGAENDVNHETIVEEFS